jgi:hypothetical protein
VALLPFAFFAAAQALPDVVFANFIWPLSTYSDLNAAPYAFPIWDNVRVFLGRHAHQPVLQMEDVVFAAPFLLVAVLPLLLPLAARWSGARWFATPLLPYWLAGYALWLAELHRLDMGHLRNGTLILALFFFSICEAGGNKYLRGLGLGFTICAAIAGTSALQMSWENNLKLQTRRGTIYVKERHPLFEFLENNTSPGEQVFVYPYQPFYYFAEDLRNPTRFSYLQYHFHTDAQFAEAVGDLERKKVRYVVFDSEFSGPLLAGSFPAYKHPDPAKLIMEPYLESHYRMVRDLGRFHILERLNHAP